MAEKIKQGRTRSRQYLLDTNAFICMGLSGIGLLTTAPEMRVRSLKRGETVAVAWSRVGNRLNTQATKILNERRKVSGE